MTHQSNHCFGFVVDPSELTTNCAWPWWRFAWFSWRNRNNFVERQTYWLYYSMKIVLFVIKKRMSQHKFPMQYSFLFKGNFGRKEKNGWRSQSRNGSENVNLSGTFNGTGSRSRSSTFHGGKTHGHREGSSLENETTRKEDREKRKQFEAEDFVSRQWGNINLGVDSVSCEQKRHLLAV